MGAEVKSWNDLIFENRNHAYGAYVIRNAYGNNVIRAALLAAGIAACVLSISFVLKGEDDAVIAEIPTHPPLKLGPDVVIQPVKPEPQSQSKKQRSRADLTPKPTAEPVRVEDNIPALDELQSVFPTGDDVVGEPGLEGIGGETVTIDVAPPPVEEEVILSPQVMPSYKGGPEAMVRFLARNMKYPAVPRRLGVEGTVYVSFVIGKRGEIEDAQVVKGIDPACDAEAVRVVNLMNKWNPGQQGGRPVKVRMMLPIRFAIQ